MNVKIVNRKQALFNFWWEFSTFCHFSKFFNFWSKGRWKVPYFHHYTVGTDKFLTSFAFGFQTFLFAATKNFFKFFVAFSNGPFKVKRKQKAIVLMVVPHWTLTSLAPSLHLEFSVSILNLKRAPVTSMFIEGLPLPFEIVSFEFFF